MAALALPASSKFLVDEVVTPAAASPCSGRSRPPSWPPPSFQALTSLAALARARRGRAAGDPARSGASCSARSCTCPSRSSTRPAAAVLITRIMTDPEGVRNLLGTGLVQLAGSLLTAVLALGVLLWLNWRLTAMTLVLLGAFAALIVYAFQRSALSTASGPRSPRRSWGGWPRRSPASASSRRTGPRSARRGASRADLERLFASVAREVTASAAVGALALVLFGGISALLVFFGGREILAGDDDASAAS